MQNRIWKQFSTNLKVENSTFFCGNINITTNNTQESNAQVSKALSSVQNSTKEMSNSVPI